MGQEVQVPIGQAPPPNTPKFTMKTDRYSKIANISRFPQDSTMAKRNLWTREEIQRALVLYLGTPFGQIHSGNPKIIELARQIGRTPSAIALKMSNLAGIDESLDRKGMANSSALDKQVWQEFLAAPDTVVAVSETMHDNIQYAQKEYPEAHSFGEGTNQIVRTTQRRGQGFFRRTILTSYGSRCALTDLDDPRLLVASHIIGWAERAQTRLNPHNGICLNALHDRAFDKHLISFGENFELLVADNLPRKTSELLHKVKHQNLRMPERFLPSQDFLEAHRQQFYSQ